MAFLGVYGHVNVDFILRIARLPLADQTVPVERELVRLGGTAGNLARATAALGVPTALASFVGDDFPPNYRSALESAGIELVDLRRLEGPTPKVWILSSAQGEQSAVIDQGVMGDGHVRPRLDYTMLGSEWVHFATGPPPDHYAVAKEAARIGKHVAFDPAQELSYRYPDRAFELFIDESDLFFANRRELARALEKLGYGDPRQLLDHAGAVLETRGPDGSILYTEKETLRTPACPLRLDAPPETTGAGDVLRAGVYAALHSRRELGEAVRWGAVASSLFLDTRGERFPSAEELAMRLEEWRT